MKPKNRTAIKVLKCIRFALFPLFCLPFLIWILRIFQTSSMIGLALLWMAFFAAMTAPLLLSLVGILTWVIYILEGYVSGFFKWARCVMLFLISAFGTLFSIGWWISLCGGYQISQWLTSTPFSKWLFTDSNAFYFIVALFLLVYPLLFLIESVFRKDFRLQMRTEGF